MLVPAPVRLLPLTKRFPSSDDVPGTSSGTMEHVAVSLLSRLRLPAPSEFSRKRKNNEHIDKHTSKVYLYVEVRWLYTDIDSV